MKIKFIHAVLAFIGIMIVLAIFGMFGPSSGQWPGIPSPGKKTVVGYVGLTCGPLCFGIKAWIEGLSIQPGLCIPEAGDPDGDIIIFVYHGQDTLPMYSLKIKSDCDWFLGCSLHKQFNLCLSPGIYRVKIKWNFCETYSEDEKTITVS